MIRKFFCSTLHGLSNAVYRFSMRCVVLEISREGGGVEINSPAGSMLAQTPAGARVNPRTAGGLSHFRTAGGGADDRPPENSKTKKDSDKR